MSGRSRSGVGLTAVGIAVILLATWIFLRASSQSRDIVVVASVGLGLIGMALFARGITRGAAPIPSPMHLPDTAETRSSQSVIREIFRGIQLGSYETHLIIKTACLFGFAGAIAGAIIVAGGTDMVVADQKFLRSNSVQLKWVLQSALAFAILVPVAVILERFFFFRTPDGRAESGKEHFASEYIKSNWYPYNLLHMAGPAMFMGGCFGFFLPLFILLHIGIVSSIIKNVFPAYELFVGMVAGGLGAAIVFLILCVELLLLGALPVVFMNTWNLIAERKRVKSARSRSGS